jgi:hypothetical protein
MNSPARLADEYDAGAGSRQIIRGLVMTDSDLQILLAIAVLMAGGGMFLRLVAKEKHRREKWLQFRLEEKVKQLKKQNADLQKDKIFIAR